MAEETTSTRARIGTKLARFVRSPILWIVVFAVVLRVWNFDFDPYMDNMPFTPDAEHKLRQAIEVAGGRVEPHRGAGIYFKQPYFLIYSAAAALKLFRKTDISDFAELWPLVALYPILFSVLTVLLLYHLAFAVFDDKRIALLAALILAVVPLDVIGSRYFKEDIPLMFFTTLSLFMMVRLIEKPSAPNYLLTGLAIGLAAATKYASVMLLVFLVAAHACSAVRRGSRILMRKMQSLYLLLAIVCAAAVFLAVDPYVIIEWDAFYDQLSDQIKYSAGGHSGTSIRAGDFFWCFYLAYAIVPGLSIPVTLTALTGIIWSAAKKNIRAIFLGVWALFFYFCVESSPAKPFPFFARYLHPLVPCLCMFSAFAFVFLRDSLCKTVRARRLMATLIVVCLFCPLGKTALINASLKKDTRVIASEWINENIEEGSTVGIDTPTYGPRPSRARFTVFHKWRLYRTSFQVLEEKDTDYIVLNNFKAERFNYCYKNSKHARDAYSYYMELADRYELVKEIKPAFRLQSYGFHNPIISIYRVQTPAEQFPLQ